MTRRTLIGLLSAIPLVGLFRFRRRLPRFRVRLDSGMGILAGLKGERSILEPNGDIYVDTAVHIIPIMPGTFAITVWDTSSPTAEPLRRTWEETRERVIRAAQDKYALHTGRCQLVDVRLLEEGYYNG